MMRRRRRLESGEAADGWVRREGLRLSAQTGKLGAEWI